SSTTAAWSGTPPASTASASASCDAASPASSTGPRTTPSTWSTTSSSTSEGSRPAEGDLPVQRPQLLGVADGVEPRDAPVLHRDADGRVEPAVDLEASPGAPLIQASWTTRSTTSLTPT